LSFEGGGAKQGSVSNARWRTKVHRVKQLQPLRERLATRPALLGLLQTHPNDALSEMAGMCGYDFVLLDGEHGVFSESELLQALRTLAASGTLGFVRLAERDTHALGRYMDMGAGAIVVPNVSTADEVRALVRAMEYPPAGTRGFGATAHRATRYGMDLAAHLDAPRESVSLIVIVESALGVSNVEEILAVDGVDGVIVGPSDLSANLGRVGEYANSAYVQAMARIEQAAAANGKLLGTAPHAGNPIDVLLGRGHRLFILGADMPLIRDAMCSQLSAARSSL
jgi:4-hydroxy-2-oxoheptanedioate aldolase